MKVLGVIPARLTSTRLPGKVLLDIAGKPMLQWVYENAVRSTRLTELVVATENEEIERWCRRTGIPVTLTARHPSGADRLHEVLSRTDAAVYVNIQGDEPTVRPEHIDLLLRPLLSDEAVQVTTLKVAIDPESAQDPDNVKVVTADDGRALYFSRWPIPYDQGKNESVQYYKHLGLYAYRRDALERFHSLPRSPLERAERLEQLRFLQNGVPIYVLETPYDAIGVDTEADLQRVCELFNLSHPG
ncbi:MAG: 3-deoxy-manno-octulosonate cytidylyltransferase [Acidobacteriota bacterium]